MTAVRDEGMNRPEERATPERPDGLSLALNALPFVVIGLGLGMSVVVADGGAAVALFLAWLYLVPALLGGLVTRAWPTPNGTFGLGDPGVPDYASIELYDSPTGVDLDRAQWRALLPVLRERELLPFLDLAYQGYGEGIAEDAFRAAAE